jgi:hypothetical protein
VRKSRRFALLPLAAIAGVLAALAVVIPSAAPASTARGAKLVVGAEVLRFQAQGRKLTGKGVVTATLTESNGRSTTAHIPVALTASTGGGCRVLHLFLQQLNLNLLGLNAHLDKVQLNITGDPSGGVLGRLFCRLARAKVASTRASAASALDVALRHHRGAVVHFTARLTPKATASAVNPTCSVLDLVVGPLNLQLLGLVVDLNRVHLNVTATRGQGALGDLFCNLADNATTTATTTTTAP